MAIIVQQGKYIGGDLHEEVFDHSKWLRFAGFVLLLLGSATVLVPFMPISALHSAAVPCGLLATSGFVYVLHAVAFWRNRWLGFALHVMAGIVYLTAGYLVFIYPLADIRIIGAVLIASYLLVGLFRIAIAMGQGIAILGWSWTLICGVVNIALAYFLWTQLSTITAGLLALTIGIELLFTGLALLMLGVKAKREIRRTI